MKFRFVCISLAMLFAACSQKQQAIKPTEVSNTERTSDRGVSVVQLEKFFNKPSDQAFSAVLDSLKRRNIPVAGANEQSLQVQTHWTPIQDNMCENGVKSAAPLNCRVRFHFDLNSLTPVATALRGRYQELCSFNEEVRVECPNSNAENLLKTIAQEVASTR